MRKKYLLGLLLLGVYPVFAQTTKTVSGYIKSADSSRPLPSATVMLLHNRTMTTTDAAGYFTLMVRGLPDTLVVNYTGYKTRHIPVTDGTILPLPILLEQDAGELAGVIVNTGYQSIPKERATGSFVQVDKELFNRQVTTNVLDRLEAITGSLSVDRKSATPGIMIRGLSTIQGPKGPLIVLDNFPYNGDLDNINPNEVESITVLKDAAAASIWGTRAGNGVIVITTKHARTGQPFHVSLNTNITVAEKPSLGKIDQLAPADFIGVEQMLYDKGYYNDMLNDGLHQPVSPVIETLARRDAGLLSPGAATSMINALKGQDIRRDLSRYFYRPSVNQQYALSFGEGYARSSWSGFAGWDNNMNELSASYSRLNLHLENNWQPVKGLSIRTGVYYNRSRSVSGKPGYFDLTTANGALPPYTRLADKGGNALPVMKDYREGYIDTAGGGQLLNWQYYPLTDYRHSRGTTVVNDLLINTSLQYTFSKPLSLDIYYQYERQSSEGKVLYDGDSYYTRNLVNSFTQPDGSRKVPLGDIFDRSLNTTEAQSARAQLNYTGSWQDWSLAALGGGELRQTKPAGMSTRTYGYNPGNLSFVNVDLLTPYPDYITGWYNFIPDGQGYTQLTSRNISLYSNASLAWRNRYTLSGSLRRDASNLFGAAANDKWKLLWSAGAAWVVSKEPFYHSSFLPELKIRATFGYSGNADPTASAKTTIAYQSVSRYTQTPVAAFDNYANPDLRWEKMGMLNIGVDFGTKRNILRGSLEYYHKKGTDLLGRAPVDYTAGTSFTLVKNVAGMVGSGLDLQLETHNLTGVFTWSTTLNASYYKDHITRYYQASTQGSYFIAGQQPPVTGLVGKPVYSILAYQWAGLDPLTGDPQGVIGKVTSKDYSTLIGPATSDTNLVYKGSALPSLFGTLANTFSWHQWSLSIGVTYKFGYWFRRPAIDYANLFANRVGSAEFTRRWQQPGDEKHTSVPSIVYPADPARDAFYNGSEATVEKGDNIRLQYITLGYDIEGSKGQPSFNHVRLFININNLGIIWRANKLGLDPDYPATSLPPVKNIAAGLNIQF